MTEEVQEVPKWLKELEEKREKRVKARLGHETGAGSPCLTCEDKCPGLDLHFWRKICKSCKCGKESHDVNDEDIYGWAQFQLLGSKPNKSKKFVIPGRKDAVELDWVPKGVADAVESYLKDLPINLLPIKGSLAALERKQLLQKQIPLHDIDPFLCHGLTENEVKQMNAYIADVKQNSVGVGRILKLSEFLVTNRSPMQIPQIESIILQGANRSSDLVNKNLQSLKLDDEKQFTNKPKHYESIPNVDNSNDLDIKALNNNEVLKTPQQNLCGHGRLLVPNNLHSNTLAFQYPTNPGHVKDQHYDTNTNETTSKPYQTIKDLVYSTYDPKPSNKPDEINLTPTSINIGTINDIEYPIIKLAVHTQIGDELPTTHKQPHNALKQPHQTCHKCKKTFDETALVIGVDRTESLWHSDCFKCSACNQNLADLMYFYDKSSNDIYCGRDYAKIRGIPRCQACDELIFVQEYCLAENSTFHVKHFCCFECDGPLAGQNYVMEESQPLCLPCFEQLKAEKCNTCMQAIKPDEEGANLNGVHFHADKCFVCRMCTKQLLGGKFLFRNSKLYCSAPCFGADT